MLVSVTLEQRVVPVVGLPREIEDVAGNRKHADEGVDGHVEDHSKLDDARDAEIAALPEHRDGKERRTESTQARHQPEDRVQADANLGPWKHERGIEQTRHMLQRLESLLL